MNTTLLLAFASFASAAPVSIAPRLSPRAAPLAAVAGAAAFAPRAALSLQAVAPVAAPLAAQSAPAALSSLKAVAAPLAADVPSARAALAAGSQFDGTAQLPHSSPDDAYQWYDRHTGENETQTSKIRKAYQLAMSNPLAAAIKNAMPQNTVYRVDNNRGNWYLHTAVRSQGDDPEKMAERSAVVVFNHNALQQLSPEFLAAKLASMWARHMYREKIPASAEKTYVEGSVLVRVFMALTGSTAQWWNGDKDYQVADTFEIYRHFYFWAQGHRFDNVRQGPYFKDKIMAAAGKPEIDADARGRRTLYQRAQTGELSEGAAEQGQAAFDGFTSNER